MISPLFPKYLLMVSRQSDRKIPLLYSGDPLPLKSFPGQAITLPLGSSVLAANTYEEDSLTRSRVLTECVSYLQQSLEKLGLLKAARSPRLLLVLPDKTRTAIASHLLLDAVLNLKETYPVLEFTILFGLGTHPLMSEGDLLQLLGKDRYQTLQDLDIPLLQQTTLAPLEQQGQVLVTADPKEETKISASFADLTTAIAQFQQRLEQTSGDLHYPQKPYLLSVPLALWQHDWTIVAGDTQLHPYEGRGGSGGIHKMLVVGLANIQCIRRTHSTKVLLAPHTRVGQEKNPFVRSLDHLAQVLGSSLLSKPNSRVCTLPLGLSVATNSQGQIWGLWLGQQERDRQHLTTILQKTYTVPLSQALHIAIADVEPYRATDILASARPLQYLCQWDEADNPLLADTPRQRVALLFYPCYRTTAQDGIGNTGTKKQLDVLQQFVQACQGQLQVSLAGVERWEEVFDILAVYRQRVLEKWADHLHIASETEDFLALLKKLARLVHHFQSLKLDEDATEIRNAFKAILKKYANPYGEVGQALGEFLKTYEADGEIEELLLQIRGLQDLYDEHEGLGEGGQRALRLLILLQKFETFLIATNNPAVLAYLSQLDPDIRSFLPSVLQSSLPAIDLRLGLLGIVGIDLHQNSPQAAIENAIAYARYHNPQILDPHIGLIQDPLILHRTEGV